MSKSPKNPERSFGLSVGVVLMLIAAFLVWRGRIFNAEILGGVGFALIALGLTQPKLLKWPSFVWWKFAMALGYINARVILSMAFLLVLTPLGWSYHDQLVKVGAIFNFETASGAMTGWILDLKLNQTPHTAQAPMQ